MSWADGGEIVDLVFEDNAGTFDQTGVEARFMDGRSKPDLTEDGIGMFFPKAGGFWVALHGSQDGDDMAGWDGLTTFVPDPPFVEGLVRENVEPLFW